MSGRISYVLLTALIVFAVAGCSLISSGDAKQNGKGTDSNTAGAEKDAASTPATTGVAGKENRVLEDKYYVDTDKNEVPDFIEIELGYDPNADDCPLVENCGNGAEGEDLNIQVNTLLMLDASGSMRGSAGVERKIDAAKASLKTFVAGAPEAVKMGFLVYGHKGNNTAAGKAASCAADGGAELLQPIGEMRAAGFDQTLAGFEPTGWTPIGLALEQARAAFAGKTGQNRIIMVSDGIETCGGNPVEVARALHSEGIKVTVDVVGFDVGSKEQQQLRRIAEAGGGEYFDAKTRSELDAYFKKQDEALSKTNAVVACLQDALLKMEDCEAEFTGKAMDYFGEEIKKLPPGDLSGKYGALVLMNAKIGQDKERRIDAYTEVREKIKANNDKAHEIVEQFLRTSNKHR